MEQTCIRKGDLKDRMVKKRVVGLVLGFVLLFAAVPVWADSELSEQQEMAEKLVESAEQLDPNSQESVEEFAELLEQWDTDLEETEESSDFAGTMQDSSSRNIQLIFAQLQQKLAQESKEAALNEIEEVQKLQSQQNLCSDVLSQLRQLQAEARSSGKPVELSQELKNNLVSLEICTSTTTYITKSEVTEEDLQNLISLTEAKMDSLSSSTQVQMVYIQDYMKQYDSYTSSSSSITEELKELLNQYATGGTMLGGNTGMLFTSLLVGVAIGAVAVLLIQKKRIKK